MNTAHQSWDTPSNEGSQAQGSKRTLVNARSKWGLVGITSFIIVAWLAAVFLFDGIGFVIFSPRGNTDFEVFLALGQLFGALVLALTSAEFARRRMKWVAAGLMVFGLGALGFGYLYRLAVDTPHLNVTFYGSLLVRNMATILLAIGLVPATVPPLDRRILIALVSAAAALGMTVVLLGEQLPPLVNVSEGVWKGGRLGGYPSVYP